MVCDTKLYKILGVKENASAHEIKKAFRTLALQHHPDKGGDSEKFKEISKAYDILSDPDKRSKYDQYGEQNMNDENFEGAEDIFSHFFGFQKKSQKSKDGKVKGEDNIQKIDVSLETLYNGKTKKIKINRKVCCEECNGDGTKNKDKKTICQVCRGQGIQIIHRQMGPMIQQMQTVCPTCNGSGKIIDDEDKCEQCKGSGIKDQINEIDLHIDKGMMHGQPIILSEQADHLPGTDPGNLVFIIQEKEHNKFRRQENDLIIVEKIELVDSLIGTEFILKHLDGRDILIRTPENYVIKSGDVLTLKGEGMPFHKTPFNYGDLHVIFEIEMPKELSETQKNKLKEIFGSKEAIKVTDNMETGILETNTGNNYFTDMKDRRQNEARGVQCAQQ